MVGHGHGRHAQFLHMLAELFHVTGAVKQRIIGMQMQVNELRHGSVGLVYRMRALGKMWTPVRIMANPARRGRYAKSQ
jgi:hypothetical protein